MVRIFRWLVLATVVASSQGFQASRAMAVRKVVVSSSTQEDEAPVAAEESVTTTMAESEEIDMSIFGSEPKKSSNAAKSAAIDVAGLAMSAAIVVLFLDAAGVLKMPY